MHLYYAIGGGLGHLMRAKKVHSLLNVEHFKVLTASDSYGLFDDNQLIQIPRGWSRTKEKVHQQLLDLVQQYQVTTLYMDTFPWGILGELDLELLSKYVKLIYIGRRLRWDRYVEKYGIKEVQFDLAYRIEAWETGQQSHFFNYAKEVKELSLQNIILPQSHTVKCQQPYYLVNHSGAIDEVKKLVLLAQKVKAKRGEEAIILVNSQKYIDIEGISQVFSVPASTLLEEALAIFTGCGFNSMTELAQYADKHYYIPFERKYDDQEWRFLDRVNR